MKKHFDVIIIGAGAAGMMCAMEAAKRGKSVAVLEHNAKIGKKIRISGGGRCNFTNINTTHQNYLSENPSFSRSALSRFSPQDFLDLVKKHNIPFHEKKLGQLFCDDSAQQIIDLLKSECDAQSVTFFLNTESHSITKNDVFHLETSSGSFTCTSLVIACGGLSIPKIGATDFGYKIAKQFGHRIIPATPALVPLTFPPDFLARYGKLSGVSIDALVSIEKMSFRENILFTHRGLSGPAILQISSYWKKGDTLLINLLPDDQITDRIRTEANQKQTLITFLCNLLPVRFCELLDISSFATKSLANLSKKELTALTSLIHQWQITPSGTEGFKKAEVTKGGVDTKEISSKTFESQKCQNLYFIGEVLDVTGHLGGYNFQWAWASGHAAALHV